MRLARTIIVMLLAVAVAVLPAIGGAVAVAKAVESAMTAPMATECCEHHGAPCAPADSGKPMNDCASLAVCAAKCFSYTGIAVLEIGYVPHIAGLTIGPVMPAVASHIDPPPFPPPRS